MAICSISKFCKVNAVSTPVVDGRTESTVFQFKPKPTKEQTAMKLLKTLPVGDFIHGSVSALINAKKYDEASVAVLKWELDKRKAQSEVTKIASEKRANEIEEKMKKEGNTLKSLSNLFSEEFIENAIKNFTPKEPTITDKLYKNEELRKEIIANFYATRSSKHSIKTSTIATAFRAEKMATAFRAEKIADLQKKLAELPSDQTLVIPAF